MLQKYCIKTLNLYMLKVKQTNLMLKIVMAIGILHILGKYRLAKVRVDMHIGIKFSAFVLHIFMKLLKEIGNTMIILLRSIIFIS